MERYIDSMSKMLVLSESCLEALEHIKARLNENAMAETIRLMDDFVSAFYQIEQSFLSFQDKLPENEINEKMNSLRKSINLVVGCYEREDRPKALAYTQFNLLPDFKRLKLELESMLHPYILS